MMDAGVKKIEEVKKVVPDVDVKEAAGTLGYRVGQTLGTAMRLPAQFVQNVRKEMAKINMEQERK